MKSDKPLDCSIRQQEDHTLDVPKDGDPRWKQLVNGMAKVRTTFAPLPDGPVSNMIVGFLCREVHGWGYHERIYMVANKDIARLLALKVNWDKADSYLFANPELSALEFIEKVESKEVQL